jgi:small-conductance mechanosensitive channel
MVWELKTRQRVVLLALGVLIVAAIAGVILTRQSAAPVGTNNQRRAPLVDEQPVKTARSLAPLAATPDEQRFARQALRIADHAVDLAFARALREATIRPPAETPETKELFAHVRRTEASVKSDQELIDSLKKDAAGSKMPAEDLQQQLDVFQAQLELDKDEMDEAKGDLLRSGADPLSRIQRQFARYQSAQQGEASSVQPAGTSSETEFVPNNLIAQVSAWRLQRANALKIQAARDEALQKHDQLKEKHAAAEQETPDSGPTANEPATSGASQDAAVIASLRHLAQHQKNLIDLNRLVQDHQDLADAYANWLILVQSRQEAILRRILEFVLLVLLVILGVYLADLAVDGFFAGYVSDGRRARTLRVIARFAIQAVGILIIAFVLLGIPAQMPTIIGLAGAGLTVVLKDFIVGFFGWFTLMGRNGIRVGDWVEIEGVVGEVAEISLLRTVLLETGNWNDAGHPTGRKVAFVNSYAIEGHYFNFSTSGQWLWDELKILLPSSQNPYPVLDAIQKLVTDTTAASAQSAEEEWKRATHHDQLGSVSAAPAINLRPTSSGVEIYVRYITRAQERYATRTKLYQDIAALLHQWQGDPAVPATPAPFKA